MAPMPEPAELRPKSGTLVVRGTRSEPAPVRAGSPSRPRAARFSTQRPHVALLVETSLASGRDILRGIARYVREHEPWALYHEPRSLEETLPSWLRHWQGDGIIVRAQNDLIARGVQATGIPAVDVLAWRRRRACRWCTWRIARFRPWRRST
jgi:hypothetical protein